MVILAQQARGQLVLQDRLVLAELTAPTESTEEQDQLVQQVPQAWDQPVPLVLLEQMAELALLVLQDHKVLLEYKVLLDKTGQVVLPVPLALLAQLVLPVYWAALVLLVPQVLVLLVLLAIRVLLAPMAGLRHRLSIQVVFISLTVVV
jgi:hypothetical protein